MDSLTVLLKCFLVFILLPFNECTVRGPGRGIILSYVCASNGRIDLEFSGNNVGKIRYGLGVCGRQSIMVNFTSGTDHGTLSGCEKNKDIYLYMYDHDPVHVSNTSAIQTFVLHCNTENRSPSAVPMKRSIEFPQSRRSVMLSESNTPSTLIMDLVNETRSIRNIILGGQYTLRISGPQNYTLFPESCYAASDETFQRQVTLMENGCTRDKTLLAGFHQQGTQSIVEATLQGFHLVYSSTVYIQCNVNMCTSSQCQIKPEDSIETDCNTYGYITNKNISNSGTVESSQRVATSFTVKDPALEISNSASDMSVSTLVLWLAMYAVYISFQP
ncbi:uncharacterized protein LOC110453356 [Mizuhopecten yessoensis]|uniref:ZP domain-containing protein n=1 Tax=Mizuhopecten yessoensis TaxID=6573 RepID=A0A210R4X1_MIZYE|nr:uncharacterized protein LOC110453356 [Mizuhopecten yessoensis]OWF55961.1 hypothetical protein KP79_PYT22117 [Mizuhopecten yessoensis]